MRWSVKPPKDVGNEYGRTRESRNRFGSGCAGSELSQILNFNPTPNSYFVVQFDIDGRTKSDVVLAPTKKDALTIWANESGLLAKAENISVKQP